MLSSTLLHARIPRTLVENVRYRLRLLDYVRDSPERQAAVRAACESDCLFYINTFGVQYNPLKSAGREVGPFLTWPFQDDAILDILQAIEEGRDRVIEKSREMGATWIVLWVFDWLARFKRYKKFLMISRSGEAVDKPGDSDSLFWKLDFMDENLPGWLGGGPAGAKIRPDRIRSKMLIRYPLTGSQIAGQASTGKAGVGGRATAIFVDEFAQIVEDREVRQHTANTSNCRIFTSTHVGLETEFFKICQQPEIKKIVMHWSQHPDKRAGAYHVDAQNFHNLAVQDKEYVFPSTFEFNRSGRPTGGPFPGLRSPWYDVKATAIGNLRGVAMDLDIDPLGTTAQVFDPLVIRGLIQDYACEPYWQGDVRFDPRTGHRGELVQGRQGRVRLWTNPTYDGKVARASYAAAADCALGTGATPSCLTIMQVTAAGEGEHAKAGRKVLEYADPEISPDEFAVKCVALCRLFCDEEGTGATLIWECDGPGVRFGIKVVESGWRAMYYDRDETNIESNPVKRPGFYPTPSQKNMLIQEYDLALRRRLFENRSREALEECLNFEYDGRGNIQHNRSAIEDDPSGSGSNHGDRVIADALAWKLAKHLAARIAQQQSDAPAPGSFAWRREQRQKAAKLQEAF